MLKRFAFFRIHQTTIFCLTRPTVVIDLNEEIVFLDRKHSLQEIGEIIFLLTNILINYNPPQSIMIYSDSHSSYPVCEFEYFLFVCLSRRGTLSRYRRHKSLSSDNNQDLWRLIVRGCYRKYRCFSPSIFRKG